MNGEDVPVFVVDDQPAFRIATAALLQTCDGFVFAGEADTGETAIVSVPAVGIVLMDINMPGMGGIEATRRIRAEHAEVVVLLMSTYDREGLPVESGTCGASGYLHKERLSCDVLAAAWSRHGVG